MEARFNKSTKKNEGVVESVEDDCKLESRDIDTAKNSIKKAKTMIMRVLGDSYTKNPLPEFENMSTGIHSLYPQVHREMQRA